MKAAKTLFLVLLLALIPFQSAFAAEKSVDLYVPMDDEFYDHWAFEEMTDLINADIIEGYVDEYDNMFVKPNDQITRAQFVKMIVSALGLTSNGAGKTFADVKSSDWFYESVRITSGLGIVNGKDANHFSPYDQITRAEMTKMIVLSFEKSVPFPNTNGKVFKDVPKQSWAYEFINKASSVQIVNGNGDYFSPANHATRAEAMVMIHRALQKEQSNLPKDAELTSFLKDHITRENALSETNDSEGLSALYKENATGYFRAEGLMLTDGLLPETEEDIEFTIDVDDSNLTLDILQVSNRFATVEASGMTVSVVIKSPDFNMDFKEEMSGVYQLKKDLISNEWKIYNYTPNLEGIDEEELSEFDGSQFLIQKLNK
jgi:hypothetical protein